MHILDLPDHLLVSVFGQATFRQQEQAASTNSQLRAAVAGARRAAAEARVADPDRVVRGEALPLFTELGIERDAMLTGAAPRPPPYARVLEAFDRLVPPPTPREGQELPEGDLHRWYRSMADLAKDTSRVAYTTPHTSGVVYSGGVDSWGEKPEGFGTTTRGDGREALYAGTWRDGRPLGLGLVTFGPPDLPYAWFHGNFDVARRTGPGHWATLSNCDVQPRAIAHATAWMQLEEICIYLPGQAPSPEFIREVEADFYSATDEWLDEEFGRQ